MRNIKLADGSIYPVDRCGADNGILTVNVITGTIISLIPVFGDPEKTATIEHYFDGTETDHITFTGYTELIGATVTTTGTTFVMRNSNG